MSYQSILIERDLTRHCSLFIVHCYAQVPNLE